MGCKVNSCDSYEFSIALLSYGFVLGSNFSEADVIIINSCAVTSESVRKTRQYIRKFRKLNKSAFIILTGCASILFEFENNKYLDKIIKREELVNFLLNKFNIKDKNKNKFIFKDKTRAFLKIEDGCDNFCSYCIVPFVRGREISRNFDDIINECKNYILNGTKIITFLGQNVNSYNFNGIKFQDLLKEVDKIDGDFVIRFMTSHPKDFTNELVDVLCECKHFSKQLHLPVQSGNNRILKIMNRKYTREDYIEKIKYAREKIDDLVITSDIIVGFPSETEEEFEDTISLVKEVKFFSLFNFIYSPRKGTCAANMNDFIPYKEKSERMTRLIKIQDEISEDLYSKLIGKTYRSFVEEIFEDFFVCRTESNLILKIPKKINNHMIGDNSPIFIYCF